MVDRRAFPVVINATIGVLEINKIYLDVIGIIGFLTQLGL